VSRGSITPIDSWEFPAGMLGVAVGPSSCRVSRATTPGCTREYSKLLDWACV
jgi:hypothetical protein